MAFCRADCILLRSTAVKYQFWNTTASVQQTLGTPYIAGFAEGFMIIRIHKCSPAENSILKILIFSYTHLSNDSACLEVSNSGLQKPWQKMFGAEISFEKPGWRAIDGEGFTYGNMCLATAFVADRGFFSRHSQEIY